MINYILPLFLLFACSQTNSQNIAMTEEQKPTHKNLEVATLGAGCFWCVEAVYQRLKGVEGVASGYMGGKSKNPTYKEVCSGTSGYAEVIQVSFDPAVVSYQQVIDVFFHTHDPTTLNKQGNDEGTQYRSAIFYHSDAQKTTAEKVRKEAQTDWDKPIVTEITAASTFYKAEAYHQNYYNDNSNQPYCYYVINPKLDKFKKRYKELLKKE